MDVEVIIKKIEAQIKERIAKSEVVWAKACAARNPIEQAIHCAQTRKIDAMIEIGRQLIATLKEL